MRVRVSPRSVARIDRPSGCHRVQGASSCVPPLKRVEILRGHFYSIGWIFPLVCRFVAVCATILRERIDAHQRVIISRGHARDSVFYHRRLSLAFPARDNSLLLGWSGRAVARSITLLQLSMRPSFRVLVRRRNQPAYVVCIEYTQYSAERAAKRILADGHSDKTLLACVIEQWNHPADDCPTLRYDIAPPKRSVEH